VKVWVKSVEKTEKSARAVIAVRAGPWETEYNVYMTRNEIVLYYSSTDAERVHQLAHVLKLMGVKKEPRKIGSRKAWQIKASTDVLASKTVLPAFREALASAVEKAAEEGWVEADTARRWVEKLRRGVTTAEDKPKFKIRIAKRGGLEIAYMTTSAERLAKYAEELKSLGLEEGVHFIKREPEDDKPGVLRIAVEGVVKLGELAHHAEDAERRLEAARWVKHLLARARESGGEAARERVGKLVEEGAARGALTLTGLRQEAEGGRHLVEIRRAEARIEEGRLKIRVEAVVDGVEVEREFTFFRDVKNNTVGYVPTRADAPGGREADITRLRALATVVFGEPGRMSGRNLRYTRRHLEHATRFKEIKEAAEKWRQESRKTKISNADSRSN